MEKNPSRLPSQHPATDPHPVFPNKSVFDINRARHESVDYRGLNLEEKRDRIKMEVYLNVKDLLDGRATEKQAFDVIFRLIELYPR
jgi:hypothetical protein